MMNTKRFCYEIYALFFIMLAIPICDAATMYVPITFSGTLTSSVASQYSYRYDAGFTSGNSGTFTVILSVTKLFGDNHTIKATIKKNTTTICTVSTSSSSSSNVTLTSGENYYVTIEMLSPSYYTTTNYTYTLTIGSGSSTSAADVTVSAMSLAPYMSGISLEDITTNDAVNVNYTVKNIGTGTATNTQADIYDGTTLLDSVSIGSLAAGESVSRTFTIGAAQGYLSAGNHTIKVSVSCSGETHKNNNTSTASLKVNARKPDLYVYSWSLLNQDSKNTTSFYLGDTIKVQMRIKNQGNTLAEATTAKLTIGNITQYISMAALGMNTSVYADYSATIAASSVGVGSYTLTLQLNYNNVVSESNTSNNTVNTTVTIANNTPTLSYISILGSTTISFGNSSEYTCMAYYSNGSSKLVSPRWSRSTTTDGGSVADKYVIANNTAAGESVILSASYGEGGITKTATKSISLLAPAKTLSSISITGEAAIASNSSKTYSCTATYSDNTSVTVTPTWSISPTTYASVSTSGTVTNNNATAENRTVTLTATCTVNGVTKTATKTISLIVAASGNNYVVRSISGTTVTISVNPPAGIKGWGIEEIIPAGLTPAVTSTGGNSNWNSNTRKLTWYGTNDTSIILSYSLDGNEGEYIISGSYTIEGNDNVNIAGDTQVIISLRHPADCNPPDWQVEMKEAIGYVTKWQEGEAPMNYAIRGIYLWQKGTPYYSVDNSKEKPACWLVNETRGGNDAEGTIISEVSGSTVTLHVRPGNGVSSWGIEEHLPAGVEPVVINTNGNHYWNASTHILSWYATNGNSIDLSYALSGNDGTYVISGKYTFNGNDEVSIAGDRTVTPGTKAEWEYELDASGNARIIAYNGNAQHITIPSLLDNHRVTSISEGTFGVNNKLQSVTLPVQLQGVSQSLFASCGNLSSVSYTLDGVCTHFGSKVSVGIQPINEDEVVITLNIGWNLVAMPHADFSPENSEKLLQQTIFSFDPVHRIFTRVDEVAEEKVYWIYTNDPLTLNGTRK